MGSITTAADFIFDFNRCLSACQIISFATAARQNKTLEPTDPGRNNTHTQGAEEFAAAAPTGVAAEYGLI